MELYLYEGKIEKDILAKALDDLKVTEEEILYKKEVKKGGLFKSESLKYTIIRISDITNYIKDFLNNIFIRFNIAYKTSSL